MDEIIQEEPTAEAAEWKPDDFNQLLCNYRGGGGSGYTPWHAVLQEKFTLHPSVRLMVDAHRPTNFIKLALEFPYVSEKDPQRLAYTRTPSDGEANRQLITSVGKYLARHWPHVKDNLRRDVQALFTPDKMYIVSTMEEIIMGCELGPRSCMASVYGSIPFRHDDHHLTMKVWMEDPTEQAPDWSAHPYSCYQPKLGWSMALRKTGSGAIDGRALVCTDQGKNYFVRAYRRHPTEPDGWSQTDFALAAWLEGQGIKKLNDWPIGVKLQTPGSGDIFAPYLDGGRKGLELHDDGTSSVVERSNCTHWCESTSGYVGPHRDEDDDNDEDRRECEDCGCHEHVDDMHYTGRYDDRLVCSSCFEDYYEVRASSRHGAAYTEYYIHQDRAVEVLGRSYYIDTENLPDDIVQLEDGDYCELDDTVRIGDEYYWAEDKRVVHWEESNSDGDWYGLKEDSWEDADNSWWENEEHYLEFNPPDEDEDIDPDNPDAVEAVEEEETEVV